MHCWKKALLCSLKVDNYFLLFFSRALHSTAWPLHFKFASYAYVCGKHGNIQMFSSVYEMTLFITPVASNLLILATKSTSYILTSLLNLVLSSLSCSICAVIPVLSWSICDCSSKEKENSLCHWLPVVIVWIKTQITIKNFLWWETSWPLSQVTKQGWYWLEGSVVPKPSLMYLVWNRQELIVMRQRFNGLIADPSCQVCHILAIYWL